MSRGLCALLCPLHTSERGGEGDCVKEGGGEEGERERERAGGERLRHSPQLIISAAALAQSALSCWFRDHTGPCGVQLQHCFAQCLRAPCRRRQSSRRSGVSIAETRLSSAPPASIRCLVRRL